MMRAHAENRTQVGHDHRTWIQAIEEVADLCERGEVDLLAHKPQVEYVGGRRPYIISVAAYDCADPAKLCQCSGFKQCEACRGQ